MYSGPLLYWRHNYMPSASGPTILPALGVVSCKANVVLVDIGERPNFTCRFLRQFDVPCAACPACAKLSELEQLGDCKDLSAWLL